MHRPSPADPDDAITALLRAAGSDRAALDALYPMVYEQLRRIAHGVRGGRAGQTLCTTALVHEAYLKLAPSAAVDWQHRAHFYGVAARAMRQLLVDAARQRARAKRGGGDAWSVTFDDAAHAAPVRADAVLALDEALDRLASMDERQARVVEGRFFGGLTTSEIAEALGVSVPTVDRDWRAARAWLRRELRDHGADALA